MPWKTSQKNGAENMLMLLNPGKITGMSSLLTSIIQWRYVELSIPQMPSKVLTAVSVNILKQKQSSRMTRLP